MKFKAQAKDLQEAIRAIKCAPDLKSAPPPAIQITADEFGGIFFQRNTHLSTMRVDCPATVTGAGSALVGFEALEKRLGKAPASLEVAISTDHNNKLRIECGTWLAQIAIWPANELLPEIPAQKPTLPSFHSEDFEKGLKICMLAIWKESGRENLTGVSLRTTRGQYSLLSTDGRRVHWFKLGEAFEPVLDWKDAEGKPVPYDAGFLISQDAAHAIFAMLIDHQGALKISANHNGAQFSVGDRFIRFAIPNELMPSVNSMVGFEKPTYTFKFEKKRLSKAVTDALPTSYGDLHAIRLELVHNLLTVVADDGKGNEFKDPVQCIATPEREVHFRANAAYLADLLTACSGEEVEITYHKDYHRFIISEPDRQLAIGLMHDPAIPERLRP